ncbi:MAG: hypothetical protein QXN74_07035, partial [Saccharolobus sp.]
LIFSLYDINSNSNAVLDSTKSSKIFNKLYLDLLLIMSRGNSLPDMSNMKDWFKNGHLSI